MNKLKLLMLAGKFLLLFLMPATSIAQNNFGVWTTTPNQSYAYPSVHGALVGVRWEEILTDGTLPFKWDILNQRLLNVGPLNNCILLVYVWGLGNNGLKFSVPDMVGSSSKVKLYEPNPLDQQNPTDLGVYAPRYEELHFQELFFDMISKVRQRIEDAKLNEPDPNIKAAYNKIIAVQACIGSTGDYPDYKQKVDANGNQLLPPTDEYFYRTSHQFDLEYQMANNIHVIYNPGNNNTGELAWLLGGSAMYGLNPPFHSWIKMGDVGHAFQLNGEKDYYTTLNPKVNLFQLKNGEYIRTRSEMALDVVTKGWWAKPSDPGRQYRSMLALMGSALYFGLDITNQLPATVVSNCLGDNLNWIAYDFFDRNSLKEPIPKYGFCMLRDGLDASNTRFDNDPNITAEPYPGTDHSTPGYTLAMKKRMLSITGGLYIHYDKETGLEDYRLEYPAVNNPYAIRGAVMHDLEQAVGQSQDNQDADDINDVGDQIIEGNYEKFITQIPSKPGGVAVPLYTTCDGWWNLNYNNWTAVKNANGTVSGGISPFGKWAKSIENLAGKNAMYFDIDNNWINGYTGNLEFTITYLDDGGDYPWRLWHWLPGTGQTYLTSSKKRPGNPVNYYWKQQKFTLPASYFTAPNANKCQYQSDFFLKTQMVDGSGGQRTKFCLIEVKKADAPQSIISNKIVINHLKISPNPASFTFTIQTDDNTVISNVKIYNQQGVLLLDKQTNDKILHLHKSEFRSSAGIYFISGSTKDGKVYSSTIKIID